MRREHHNSLFSGILSLLSFFAVVRPAAAALTNDVQITSFETAATLSKFTANNTTVSLATNGVTDGLKSARAVFANVDWPNIYFKLGTGFTNGDWRGCGGLAVDILNTNPTDTTVAIRVDDDFSADGVNHCQTGSAVAPAGQAVTLVLPLTNTIPAGMRGGPPVVANAINMGVYGAIDLSHIVAFQIFLPKPGRQVTLCLDNIRWVPIPSQVGLADAYGQFTGADWPGKIHQDSDFQNQNTNEIAWLAANPKPKDRDAYGAWSNGPVLKSTGYFRTAYLVDGLEVSPVTASTNRGRWWLVAPSGRLFFSMGVDVIDYGETTAVADRESLFTWLPVATDPLSQFSYPGTGRTANFEGMNLWRKYGSNYKSLARTRALDRLESWGFNTIGNWSTSDLYPMHRVPYTVPVGYDNSSLAKFSSAGQSITDVFDPGFPARVAAGISNAVSSWKSDPWCVGYFVENELPWGGWGTTTSDHYALPLGVLASTNSLPSKVQFASLLQTRYASLAQLNAAWGTAFTSWGNITNSAVTLPAQPTGACQSDLSAFLTNFAQRYFSIVSTNVRKFAPNQLYLGCRFASRPDETVRVAANYCDVVTFNIYNRSLDSNTWAFTATLGKPCLIGEFHFGALDRGMFHPGLVQAKNQADRGQAYQEYLRSVVSLPAFVGCQWFQYCDEPLTGRFDGENYNIGFVSGTDTPYWEIISSARQLHTELYSLFAAPDLSLSVKTNTITLNWPFLGSTLEQSDSLSPGISWRALTNQPALTATRKIIQLPAATKQSYYRLTKP